MIFGTQLLALTEDGSKLLIWDTVQRGILFEYSASFQLLNVTYIALQASIEFDASFTATSLLHPSTYLNKILVASSEGTMQLWNTRTK